jgi:RNA-directed DNA polymerase
VLEVTKQEREKPDFNLIRMKLGIKIKAWSDRMLAALVNGVKGNKWFSLIDKVISTDTMIASWERVEKNQGSAGVDKVTIEKFGARYMEYIAEIQKEIRETTYKPLQIMRKYIPKGDGKMRPLGLPCVKDRIVQGAIKLIIEPIFEYEFSESSYGFRPGRGCKDALRKVQENLELGYTHVVDADLQSYFDTIPHDKLMERIQERIADGRVLDLIQGFLKQEILEECKEWVPTSGSPQGAVLSPLLANIYLHPLDKLLEENKFRMVRYADDFVIMCKTKEEAQNALNLVKEWVNKNGLILHPDKTHIGDCNNLGEGFEFLGYRFEKGQRHVRKKSLNKFKDKIRSLTKRNNGFSMSFIIDKLNSVLRGWFGYFKHAHPWTFERLDGWIRRRLRAILKRREKGSGMGKTIKDHIKWPNNFFAKAKLFSLENAYKQAKKCATTSIERANPEVVTIDWRAVCGRTACTVRREGWLNHPYPYIFYLFLLFMIFFNFKVY